MASGLKPFCDPQGKFRKSQVDGFHGWSEKLVHFPKPEELHSYIRLSCSEDGLGVHALANRNFESGDLVLAEEALIKIGKCARSDEQRMNRRFGQKATFLLPAMAIAWEGVSEEQRKAALDLFFVHPSMQRADGQHVEGNLIACRDMINEYKQLACFQPLELLQFLHIIDLNIHKDDEDSERHSAGIFVLGSKFSHSCASNCSWSFNAKGHLQYHAIRPIRAGEPLTFSYIGNGMNLLMSTLERRRRLCSLWFVCQCARCCQPDFARRMSCPRCKADGSCLPNYNLDVQSINTGNAPPSQIPDADTWSCSACSAKCRKDEMPLQAESSISEALCGAMSRGRQQFSGPVSKEVAFYWKIKRDAQHAVGSKHWITALATFAWLQQCLVQLKCDPVILHTEAQFQKGSRMFSKWLEENAPDNVEQRLSALFASVRLESDLGGGMAAFGYDLDDKLGGSVSCRERLKEHGWDITPEGSMKLRNDEQPGDGAEMVTG